MSSAQVGQPRNITESTIVTPRACELLGIFVASASSTPTIAVYDAATAVTTTIVVNTFTPVAAQWYPMPFACSTGCYVVISGTVDCTVSTRPA